MKPLALPTDEAVMIALRTQQIIAEESGVANVVDPFGGSYFMETLTNRVERDALDYIRKIDEMGGIVAAVERGFPQAEIANSAYHFQKQMETGDKIMVGVNKYKMEEPKRTIETLYIDRSVEKKQIQRLVELRANEATQAQAHADAHPRRERSRSKRTRTSWNRSSAQSKLMRPCKKSVIRCAACSENTGKWGVIKIWQ